MPSGRGAGRLGAAIAAPAGAPAVAPGLDAGDEIEALTARRTSCGAGLDVVHPGRATMSIMRRVLLAGAQSPWLRERAMRTAFVKRSVARFT